MLEKVVESENCRGREKLDMSKESFQLFRGELMGANLRLALKALSIAEDAHAGVFRKDGTTPYIEHPMKVASMLFDLGCRDEEVLAVAILHDVIEDTATQLSYGPEDSEGWARVINSVNVLTKTNKTTEQYYEDITNSEISCIIKLADRCHNLSTLYNFSEEKKAKYLDETVKYVYPLIHYAEHHYYKYSSLIRTFDLWIESIVNNLIVYKQSM